MRIDPRFLVESGTEIFTGCELLLKGCLETPGGVGLLTGYPGSPVAGFFDACHDVAGLLNEHGIAAKMANNEALAVAMVNGAQMVGVKAIANFHPDLTIVHGAGHMEAGAMVAGGWRTWARTRLERWGFP